MGLLLAVLKPLGWANELLLKLGRAIGIIAIALMVLAILIQVVFRYGFNNALPWPDEAARFCMLWSAGLMAPTAFRRGGFVAIDILEAALPNILSRLLNFLLLLVCLTVLIIAVQIGFKEVTGFGGKFATASLYLPVSLDLSSWYRIPKSWMMLSLFVGVILLLAVNVELLLRSFLTLLGWKQHLPLIPGADTVGAE